LKDEKSEADLAGQTLQSLKLILEPPSLVSPDYPRLVHGLLSGCLINIDEMQYDSMSLTFLRYYTNLQYRGREGAISAKKIKNNLLATVLVLTTVPPSMKLASPVLERCCFIISSRLAEAEAVSKPVRDALSVSDVFSDVLNCRSLCKNTSDGQCRWSRQPSTMYSLAAARDD
jgi:hypothetical protein